MMRSRGIRLAARAVAGAWTATGTVDSTGAEITLPWTRTPEVILRPFSIYIVQAYGWWSVSAAAGGCEGVVSIKQDGTTWVSTYVASDSPDTDKRHWRIQAVVRTGLNQANISPIITAQLAGSSSGLATFHVGAGLVPAALTIRRANTYDAVAGLGGVIDL